VNPRGVMLTRPVTRAAAVLAAAVMLASAGCGRARSSQPSRSVVHLAKIGELTPAEIKYGIAPTPNPNVTYQPDVILVGGGPEAIRAQSTNGIQWTIDASAPHASELRVGKVFFMTGRAVGRVLDVRPDGANLIVTLGPADITEIIRDADLHFELPIDFSDAIAYKTPDVPGQFTPAGFREGPAGGSVTNVGFMPAAAGGVPLHFKVVPLTGKTGLGLKATAQGAGLTIATQAVVHASTPHIEAVFKDKDGKILEASLELKGAAGLTLSFEAGTDVGMSANIRERLQPDTDLSIPVFGLGVPFAVTMRQQFLVTTAFGVRDTTLSAVGDFTFTGGFKAGYINGKWDIAGPSQFAVKKNLVENVSGVSLAPAGLTMSHQLKVIVGVGAAGFVAGPFFGFNSTIGITRTSDAGMVKCNQATLIVGLIGGVGYVIPRPVTNAINAVLRALNIKYQILGEGGFSSDPMTIVNKTTHAPASRACGGAE